MRTKQKDATPVSIRMDNAVLEQLEWYCDDSGQTKTLAIERALVAYIDEYKRRKAVADAADKNKT